MSQAAQLSLRAYAKINLFLQVGPRRADGYHELVSVIQSVSLYDRLHFSSREKEIALVCSRPEIPQEDNLCLKAARALASRVGVEQGVEIRLEKAIPLQAGLGGGSADAAATLLGLNELWELGLSLESLSEIGSSLGSDVPFFLRGGTALVTGRGERVEPVGETPQLDLVIARPQGGIATAEAYARLDYLRQGSAEQTGTRPEALLLAISRGDREGIARSLRNDFSPVAGEMIPDIIQLKREMVASGCLAAEVCGSGSAVFGIAAGRRPAEAVREKLASAWPWVVVVSSCSRGVERDS